MFDLSKMVLAQGTFLGLAWWQWVLVLCLVVILVAYWKYRQKQV